MINFKKVEIEDKKWLVPLVDAGKVRGCHYNFTNLFAWSGIFKYRIARIEDYLVVKREDSEDTPSYFYPVGQGDPAPIINILAQEALNCGHDLILVGLSTDNMAVLNRIFPDKFEYTAMCDSFDYVYLLEKLTTLSGDKLRSKRNHVNYFKKNNTWSFESISSENIAECWEMNVEWCKRQNCKYDIELTNENCAVSRCFDHYTELGLEGGLLRSNGKVVAYTMGGRLNLDTYDIHIEKAFEEIRGAYQMINQQFALLIKKDHPDIIYFNREEDMGDEGLRKAKQSYRPIRMEEKYQAKYLGF